MSSAKIKYDFTAIRQAVKKARHPSFQVFAELMTLFNISVDQFLFDDTKKEKSMRRQPDAGLDEPTEPG